MSLKYPVSPWSIIVSFLRHREMLWDLVRRDFIGRYQGSIMGVVWSLFNPLLMLAIYTTVFSVAFKARWGTGDESKIAFAIVLFSGMVVHSLFAECINRAPTLIVSQVNYVKKVVFPLEILPGVALCSAMLHFAISFVVLLIFCVFSGVNLHWAALFVPLLILPLILLTLGLSWILASLGVYFRDMTQIVGMISTLALFLAPVFYPVDALPEPYRSFLNWNPITLPIIQIRDVLLWDKPVRWDLWLIHLAIGTLIGLFGYWWFQKSRQGFADVL